VGAKVIIKLNFRKLKKLKKLKEFAAVSTVREDNDKKMIKNQIKKGYLLLSRKKELSLHIFTKTDK
jgi:hypothetical protein